MTSGEKGGGVGIEVDGGDAVWELGTRVVILYGDGGDGDLELAFAIVLGHIDMAQFHKRYNGPVCALAGADCTQES